MSTSFVSAVILLVSAALVPAGQSPYSTGLRHPQISVQQSVASGETPDGIGDWLKEAYCKIRKTC